METEQARGLVEADGGLTSPSQRNRTAATGRSNGAADDLGADDSPSVSA